MAWYCNCRSSGSHFRVDASGSKNSINNGYIMETAAAAMDVENEKGEMSGEGASAFVDTAAGTASETENMANSRNRPKADRELPAWTLRLSSLSS